MNYIGCFNRSRDGLQVCSPFFSFLVRLNAARCGVLPPCPLRLPGVPRCCQVWSVAAGAPFAPFLVSQWCQVWSVAAGAHSWQLVIDFIAYHRDRGFVNKYKYLRYKYIYYFINVKNK